MGRGDGKRGRHAAGRVALPGVAAHHRRRRARAAGVRHPDDPTDMPTRKRATERAVPASDDAEALFAPIAARLERDPDVSRGKGFGRGLRVKGKVFAMLANGRFVAKLPRERVDAIVAAGEGERFDPGHGRIMKEWVALHARDARAWERLAREARDHVAGGA